MSAIGVRRKERINFAVSAARANARAAGVAASINAWDARALPIPDGSVERIVSNLPWGRQVTISGGLARFYRDVCAEMRRVLAPGGRIALLTNAPQLAPFQDLRCDGQLEISLYGQTPTILTFSSENQFVVPPLGGSANHRPIP